MTGGNEGRRSRDRWITIGAVVAALLLAGHATALFPPGPPSGWASAALFTGLVFLYGIATGPGRRSGGAFLLGGLAVLPVYILWFSLIVKLDARSWYVATFRNFQVGFSDRGWGHAGDTWLLIWLLSLLGMIALALLARGLILDRWGTAPRVRMAGGSPRP